MDNLTSHIPDIRQCHVCHYTPGSTSTEANGDEDTATNCMTTLTTATNGERQKNHEELLLPMLKRCQQCKSIYYCSIACQKRDWKRHRQVCHRYQSDDSCANSTDVTTDSNNNRNMKNQISVDVGKKDTVVLGAYEELMHLLHSKPLEQVQQEYSQISDYIKEREKQQTFSTIMEDGDVSSSTDDNSNIIHNEGIKSQVGEMKMEPDTTNNSTPDDSVCTTTSDSNSYCAINASDEMSGSVVKNHSETRSSNHQQLLSRPLRWIPLVPSSPFKSIKYHSDASSSLPSLSWTFHLEYMQLLHCIQITLRPATNAKQTDENTKRDSPAVTLNIDDVRVSFDMQSKLPIRQLGDTNFKRGSKNICNPTDKTDLTPTILIFEYIDTSNRGNKSCNLSTLLRIALQIPISLWSGDQNDSATPKQIHQHPSPEYTTSLIDNNTAIAIRFTYKCNNDDIYHHADRYLPRSLDLLNINDDCDDAGINLVKLNDSGQQLPMSHSSLLDGQQQSQDCCLGCRYCHTPFIPLMLSPLRNDAALKSTSTFEHTTGNDSIEVDSSTTTTMNSNENDGVYCGLPIRYIFPLPTGHLNDLHDYLICYNDGPTNVNFDPNNNNNRYDIPPTGVIYENDIIFIVSEWNVNGKNLCSLSIPSYGEMCNSDNKNDNGMVPLDILYQSQIWQCNTLPTATELDNSVGLPETVTCSLCASIVGYKFVSEPHTNTSTVGLYLLKHQMILLQKEVELFSPPVQTLSSKTDTTQQPLTLKLSPLLMMPTLSQFLIYEMIRIAEMKGIFAFAICKNFTDVQNERSKFTVETNMDGQTKRTVAMKLRLLNWNTIAAAHGDTFVTTVRSTVPRENYIDPSKQVVSDTNVPVRVPVRQRRAKVYYETIVADGDALLFSRKNQEEQNQPRRSNNVSSFRNQFMTAHNAWCCRDDATLKYDSKKSSGLFMNGVVMTDTAASSSENSKTDETIDPTIIRIYLSLSEFDKLLNELQESSTFYSQDVVNAVRSSITTLKDETSSHISTFGLASISL